MASLQMISAPSRICTPDGIEGRSVKVNAGGAFIQFEGDLVPRGFRSQTFGYEFPLIFLYQPRNYTLAGTLLTMLKDAHSDADGRFLLTLGDSLGTNLITSAIVEIHDWNVEIRKPAGITAVSFTAVQVK